MCGASPTNFSLSSHSVCRLTRLLRQTEVCRTSLFFDAEPFELCLELFPIKRFQAEHRPVDVEGRHDSFSVVRVFDEAGALGRVFDIHFLVENSLVVEKLLGLIAVCAPTCRVDFDFGHVSPPKLILLLEDGFYYETDSGVKVFDAAMPLRALRCGSSLVVQEFLRYNSPPRCHMFFDKPSARVIVLAIALVMSFSAAGLGQDPSGRPTDPKGKKPSVKKPGPQPVTVILTVLTEPGSEVYLNGEQRGVTNSEGKVQFDKLALGHYSIEVRKDGYRPMLRGFDAGTEAPTLVFKLEPNLDDSVKEFNSLVAGGKLAGPDTPNAFELVEKLATTYPARPEVAQLRTVLSVKLMETATPVINQTAMNWRAVTREQMVHALDSATNALALKKDDVRIQAEAAYLRGVVALREWQVAGAASQAKAEGGAQSEATGNVAGPAAARAEFENALKLDDSFAAARYQLGVVLLASGDAAGAEAALVRTTQQEPQWASAHTALGSALYGEGKFADAITAFQRAVSIEANNAAAVAGLGLARVMKGEKDGSKDIERAMKLDPTSALPHLNLAIVYSQSKNKKDWSRAEDEFKKAISMNPQNIEFQNSSAERLLAEVQKKKK
jgi:Tfp pilus assembly protein PilF